MSTPPRLALLLPLLTLACPTEPEPTPVPTSDSAAAAATPPAAQTSPKGEKPPARKTKEQLEKERRTFAFQLDRTDKDIAGVEQVVKSHPTSANWARLAGQYTTRARLSGSYDDYAKAESHLATAFEASKGVKPWLQRAKFNYSLHRMERIDADLEAAKKVPTSSAGVIAGRLAFAANVAFQRGEYAESKALFDASIAKKKTLGNLSSLAIYAWKTGDFDEAEKLFREGLALYHGKPTEPIAWVHLNLGLLDLDRERYDEALAHYREAESFIAGYWLIDEHVAEILTLQGKTEEAKKLYLDIIERTQNPEFMDAMAGILREEGKEEEAKAYIAKARTRYEAQMAQYPEAAYGHALGHYLEFGEDPAFTLDLAKKNYALRANGEHALTLAQAYIGAGDRAAAKKLVAKVAASPHKSADLVELQKELSGGPAD